MRLYSGIIELKPGWFVRLPRPMTQMEMSHWRFDPVTMMVVAGVGMGISAYGTIKAGEEANAAGMWQEKALGAEATATEQAGQYESREIRKAAERAQATMIANTYAGGGVMAGSKLIGLADQAKEYEADARMTMNNYQLKAQGLRQQGAMARLQGKQARTAGYLRAAGGVAQGIGSMYSMGALGGGAGGGAGSAGLGNTAGVGGVRAPVSGGGIL